MVGTCKIFLEHSFSFCKVMLNLAPKVYNLNLVDGTFDPTGIIGSSIQFITCPSLAGSRAGYHNLKISI